MENTFKYKDGSEITVNVDLENGIFSVSRLSAGNTKTWTLKDHGGNAYVQQVFAHLFITFVDANGADLLRGSSDRTGIVRDEEYFPDFIDWTNLGGYENGSKLCLDAVMKSALAQTRVFALDGGFVAPVYFKLESPAPGTIEATILQANGYQDLEIRFKDPAEDWAPWEPFAGAVERSSIPGGIYEAQVRSVNTELMIEPVERAEVASQPDDPGQ